MNVENTASKLLLFDIGNTSMKVGVASQTAVESAYTLRTDVGQTADSLGLTLLALLAHEGLTAADITACMCSSVVPTMTPLLKDACQRFVSCTLLQVPVDVPIPLENRYAQPLEVGADRLVGAYAARQLCAEKRSLIVVDFGTATTFDCVTDMAYLGGLIFPGVYTAAAALSSHAAKLPRVDLNVRATEPAMGRDTVSSMQHGIVFGFASMVEGLTQRLARQLIAPVSIIGTGGFAKDIARITPCFDMVRPNLLLDGLRQIYARWQGSH